MRGVYVTERQGDKVTGFTLSIQGYSSRWVVQSFTRCTLATVIENAARVIHEPTVYNMRADAPIEGETYRLTGGPDDPCIANGDTWEDSKVDGGTS